MQTVSGNTEDMKQLCDVIKQVGDSVLQPLQEWTGEVPSELENLIQHFHAYVSHLSRIIHRSF